MKVQLLSDLHLEVQPGFTLRPAPDADLLVLAGDVGSYQYGSRLPGADFGLERFSPLRGWPVPVLYVPGNHEYDAIEFDATFGSCGKSSFDKDAAVCQSITSRYEWQDFP